MAKTDFTYCQGVHCPNRLQCKRFVDGLDAMKDKKNHDWIKNCRNAKLFIHKDGVEEVKQCGNCGHFDNEDIWGDGWCEHHDCETQCSLCACNEWIKRTESQNG